MKLYDQMIWADEAPDICLSKKAEIINPWNLVGFGAHLLWLPDPVVTQSVAADFADYDVVIPDIENLPGLMATAYPDPGFDQDDRDGAARAVRWTYYTAIKSVVSPCTQVCQYNQTTTFASDGYHLSTYLKHTDTAQSYLDRVNNRYDNLEDPEDHPVWFVTSPVIMQGEDAVSDINVFTAVVDGLMDMPFAGLIFWYRVAVSKRLSASLAEQHYDYLAGLCDPGSGAEPLEI